MSKNNVTAADLVAKAEEDKLIVPSQTTAPVQEPNTNDEGETGTDVVEDADLTLIEGEKKTLKERVAAVGEQLKKNKKAFIGLGVAAAAVTVVIVKAAKKRAEEVLVEVDPEFGEDGEAVSTTDDSAA